GGSTAGGTEAEQAVDGGGEGAHAVGSAAVLNTKCEGHSVKGAAVGRAAPGAALSRPSTRGPDAPVQLGTFAGSPRGGAQPIKANAIASLLSDGTPSSSLASTRTPGNNCRMRLIMVSFRKPPPETTRTSSSAARIASETVTAVSSVSVATRSASAGCR